MNNIYIPRHLQKRKRVSATTFGVRPNLVEEDFKLFHAQCKKDNITPTAAARNLLTQYANGKIKIPKDEFFGNPIKGN